jgi:hypothetical protein
VFIIVAEEGDVKMMAEIKVVGLEKEYGFFYPAVCCHGYHRLPSWVADRAFYSALHDERFESCSQELSSEGLVYTMSKHYIMSFIWEDRR